jgi:hypothetical protein
VKKILFCGCSYTAGDGLDMGSNSPDLWVNLIHKNKMFDRFELVNSAAGGRSNAGIFQDAVFNIIKNDVKYAFVCWTSMPRFELSLGLETYKTTISFVPGAGQKDHNLNDINYPKNYLRSLNDRLTTLVNLHFEILNLVHYVNSLIELCKKFKTKIYFINGLCPWDFNYFLKLENTLPESYTQFTKKLINIDNRDDQEIFDLYNKIHYEYNLAGGIQAPYWLNLYSSLKSLQLDVNYLPSHPGIKSNQLYADLIISALK